MYKAAPEVEQIPVNLIAGANIVWMDDDVIEAAEVKGWLMRMPKLYTHPQPKREPLSINQLLKIHADGGFDWCATARAVEKYYTE